MADDTLDAKTIAGRLVAHAAESAREVPDDGAAGAIRRACTRAYGECLRWFGVTGARTLLRRALTEAERQRPGLTATVQPAAEPDRIFGDPTALAADPGAAAVGTGLETLLVALLALLGRLVGDDIVLLIMEPAMGVQHDEGTR